MIEASETDFMMLLLFIQVMWCALRHRQDRSALVQFGELRRFIQECEHIVIACWPDCRPVLLINLGIVFVDRLAVNPKTRLPLKIGALRKIHPVAFGDNHSQLPVLSGHSTMELSPQCT
jgi:hypothetical protein